VKWAEANAATLAAVTSLRASVGASGPGSAVRFRWPGGGHGLGQASRWRTDVLAAAAVGAVTSAASDLAAARGARTAPPLVDVAHAWTSFHSERLLTVDGGVLPMSDLLTGDYLTRDQRWLRIHTNFEQHRAAMLNALDLPATVIADDVAAKVAAHASSQLAAGIIGLGGSAAVLRGPDEWAAHPQGRLYLSAQVMSVTRTGQSSPHRLSPFQHLAGDGVRVLDLSRVISGPVAGRVLASHGATVLRVGSTCLEQVPHLWVDTGFGKLTTDINIRTEDGMELLRRLIAEADVVIQAFRPGSLTQRGLSPEQLSGLNPGLIWVDLSAWGSFGPWRAQRGFDSIVQMASGLAYGPGGLPLPLPCQALDHATGWLAAFGALVALRRRHEEGGSWHVDVSLAQTGKWLTEMSGLASHENEAATGGWSFGRWLSECASDYGTLRYVQPPGDASGPPLTYPCAPSRSGSAPPVWPASSEY
jgi:hypothetical protein